MRIDQIVEASKSMQKTLMEFDWKKPDEVIGFLNNHGFVELGQGQYGKVFHKKGSKSVVKVATKKDRCWLAFASWTLKTPESEDNAMPNIWWIRKYDHRQSEISRAETFFIAFIEKLEPFDNEAIANTVDLPGLAWLLINEDDFMSYSTEILARFKKEGVPDLTDRSKQWETLKAYLEKNKNNTFIKTLTKSLGIEQNCRPDIHDGNLMYRPSSKHLVITDPTWAGWGNS
jgi:hypothetical protein